MVRLAQGITVAVCDAGEISRVGITRSLARHGLEVVAEAGDRADALRGARSGGGELPPVGTPRSRAGPGLGAAAEAGARAAALRVARSGRAAVVLVDLNLP